MVARTALKAASLFFSIWICPALGEICSHCRLNALDPEFHLLVPPDAKVQRLADGFQWLEGPLWVGEALLFSDIPANRIYRWHPSGRVSVFLEHSGYGGSAPFSGPEPGSNGLTRDASGRLVICEHGNRRITRLEPDGSRTVLADRYHGRRLNSPNDAVFHASGELYFTDPPFGLPRTFEDPARELDFSGIYRINRSGEVELLNRDLAAPNGLAFSPDYSTLYVTDVDPRRSAWLAFPVDAGGRLGAPRVLRDVTGQSGAGRGAPDGLEVDVSGHLFGAGPGGVFVMSNEGHLLGTIELGVPTGNLTWGDDGATLYITADTALYRVRTRTRGSAATEAP